jgi:hypothetical protein
MFTRFLRLPHEQSRAIKDELDSHMRERVRDLMLEGLSEDEGMRRAIDELGEAAELAAHFRAAHRPNRRMLMSIAAIGVAAGAAVISVVALTQQPSAAPSRATAAKNADPTRVRTDQFLDEVQVDFLTKSTDPRSTGVPVLRDLPLIGKMFVPSSAPIQGGGGQSAKEPRFDLELTGASLREVAEIVGKDIHKKVVFHANQELDVDRKIEKIQLFDVDVPAVMREINGTLGLSGPNALDFRVRAEVLEIGIAGDFDRLEKTLVAYDLRDAYGCEASTDDLVQAVLQFVESDGWQENGGNTARLKVVGSKMFVEAPPRYHERVAWIIGQFSDRGNNRHGATAPKALLPGAAASYLAEAANRGYGASAGVAAATAAPAAAVCAPAPAASSPLGNVAAPAANPSAAVSTSNNPLGNAPAPVAVPGGGAPQPPRSSPYASPAKNNPVSAQ